MKKSILSIYFILLIIGCKNQEPQKTTPQKPLEVESLIGEEGETVILGYMNRANLNTPEFQAWFQPEYDNIKIPEGWSEEFKPLAKNLEFKLFLGTWCGDTQRELGVCLNFLISWEYPKTKLKCIQYPKLKTVLLAMKKNMISLIFLP